MHKIETINSLNTLLSSLLKDWQLEGLAPSNEGLVTDVFAYIAEILLNNANRIAKTKQNVTGIQPIAPTALVAFASLSTRGDASQNPSRETDVLETDLVQEPPQSAFGP